MSNRIGQENRMAHKVVATTHHPPARLVGGGGEEVETWPPAPGPKDSVPTLLRVLRVGCCCCCCCCCPFLFFNSLLRSIGALYSWLACESPQKPLPSYRSARTRHEFYFFFSLSLRRTPSVCK